MRAHPGSHVVRLTPAYWYAELQDDGGARVEGRGGFASEDEARAWLEDIRTRLTELSSVR